MEAIIKKKSTTIDLLVGVSTEILDCLSCGELETIDSQLQKRSHLFSDLEYFDTLLKGRPTERDAAWTQQLQWLRSANKRIQDRLRLELDRVTSDFKASHMEKLKLLQEEMLEAKGQRLDRQV